VVLLLSNNTQAPVLKRASSLKVSALSFNRVAFYENEDVLNLLKKARPDLIVLAGFLWLFPLNILKSFPNKVINIHPALLPDFGGKGMYGDNVHKAVIASAKKESGITIHYVTPEYDKGDVIFQAKTQISAQDSSETLAKKIHDLEYEHFPLVIENLLLHPKNG
ncbi:MAG: formyltransferase family protein, partial [Leeuwenhoekiella sp.]